jgi:hypothetical protein
VKKECRNLLRGLRVLTSEQREEGHGSEWLSKGSLISMTWERWGDRRGKEAKDARRRQYREARGRGALAEDIGCLLPV